MTRAYVDDVSAERLSSLQEQNLELSRLVAELRILLTVAPIADLPPGPRRDLRVLSHQLALLASDA